MTTIPWRLTGTPEQQAIARTAFDLIKFPFDMLKLPGTPELGWRDLNSGFYLEGETPTARHHEGESHDDKAEPLPGKLAGRKFIFGVFYPGSAKIFIDKRLTGQWANYALATISAEIAHAVDEFLPLTDAQRQAIIDLLCVNHGAHSWWEQVDYGAEYYNLIGETFMILFTKAYSDIPFTGAEDFTHSGHNVTGEQVRAILGIERTDFTGLVSYGKRKVWHKPEHKIPRSIAKPVLKDDLHLFTKCRARACRD